MKLIKWTSSFDEFICGFPLAISKIRTSSATFDIVISFFFISITLHYFEG
jgi:hypothetical protein